MASLSSRSVVVLSISFSSDVASSTLATVLLITSLLSWLHGSGMLICPISAESHIRKQLYLMPKSPARRGNLWVNSSGRLVEEPVKLLAGGIEGTLLVFLGFHGVDQRAT